MSQTTKRALEASLKNLLAKKPLDKITINDIAEDCGISRMTFYYHFKDIYDLVEWSCVEEASRNVYHSVSREQIELFLYQVTYDLLIAVVEEKATGLQVREEDKVFIADFYKYAFVGLMLDWIRKGMKEDPNVIMRDLSLLLQGNMRAALERYRTDK